MKWSKKVEIWQNLENKRNTDIIIFLPHTQIKLWGRKTIKQICAFTLTRTFLPELSVGFQSTQ